MCTCASTSPGKISRPLASTSRAPDMASSGGATALMTPSAIASVALSCPAAVTSGPPRMMRSNILDLRHSVRALRLAEAFICAQDPLCRIGETTLETPPIFIDYPVIELGDGGLKLGETPTRCEPGPIRHLQGGLGNLILHNDG